MIIGKFKIFYGFGAKLVPLVGSGGLIHSKINAGMRVAKRQVFAGRKTVGFKSNRIG